MASTVQEQTEGLLDEYHDTNEVSSSSPSPPPSPSTSPPPSSLSSSSSQRRVWNPLSIKLDDCHDATGYASLAPRRRTWNPLALLPTRLRLPVSLPDDNKPPSKATAFILTLATCLFPSFIQLRKQVSEDAQKKLSSTAWLDGLRGVAAFFVVFTHYFHLFLPYLDDPWMADSPTRSILQMPLIRIFHSGTAMVGVFFVISGYVLSYRALQLIRLDDPTSLHNSLASSTFRRALRLFLPIIVSTFLAMLCTYFGWFGEGPGSRAPPRAPTFWEDVGLWIHETIILTDPFHVITMSGVFAPAYDANLWTIPVEFRGSAIVFFTVLGLSRAKSHIRAFVLLAILIYSTCRVYTDITLFLGGIFLADLHHLIPECFQKGTKIIIDDNTTYADTDTHITPHRRRCNIAIEILKKIIMTVLFLLSIFFLSMPLSQEKTAESSWYWILVQLTPQSYTSMDALSQFFWVIVGGLLCVWTLDNAKFLQSIFTTKIAQYLGRISYSLYLVHGTILYTLGWHMIPVFVKEDSAVRSFIGHLFGGGLLFAVIVWVADIFCRAVDERSVAFVRYIAQKCFVKL